MRLRPVYVWKVTTDPIDFEVETKRLLKGLAEDAGSLGPVETRVRRNEDLRRFIWENLQTIIKVAFSKLPRTRETVKGLLELGTLVHAQLKDHPPSALHSVIGGLDSGLHYAIWTDLPDHLYYPWVELYLRRAAHVLGIIRTDDKTICDTDEFLKLREEHYEKIYADPEGFKVLERFFMDGNPPIPKNRSSY